jgi:hypothetical protein
VILNICLKAGHECTLEKITEERKLTNESERKKARKKFDAAFRRVFRIFKIVFKEAAETLQHFSLEQGRL